MNDKQLVDGFADDPEDWCSPVNRTLGWVCRTMRELDYPDADIADFLRKFNDVAPSAKELH